MPRDSDLYEVFDIPEVWLDKSCGSLMVISCIANRPTDQTTWVQISIEAYDALTGGNLGNVVAGKYPPYYPKSNK